MKWADYLVSKVKWRNNQRIESFFVHEDNIDSVGLGDEKPRNWIIQKMYNGNSFTCIHKSEDGKWMRGSSIRLNNGGLKWNNDIPLISTKRKTFVSYYHNDDQVYKDKFINLSDDLIINKSVEDGDINSDVSDEYIKQLIQKGFLSDTTVLVVLLGNKTKCRKHVDWKISGALNYKVGDNYAGLLGLKLPSHADYGTGKHHYSNLPQRLVDNLKTGYAIIRDYTTDRKKLQEYIELAYSNRSSQKNNRINSRKQLQKNLCS